MEIDDFMLYKQTLKKTLKTLTFPPFNSLFTTLIKY